jgi:nitroreductase
MPDAPSFPGIHHPDQLVEPDTMLHFLQSKRSVRRFKPDKLRAEHLETIYSAMAAACSSHNDRSLNFAILSDSNVIKDLSQKIEDAILIKPGLGQLFGDWLRRKRARGDDPIFFNAPHVLFAYSNTENDLEGLNTGATLTYGMAMAHALGIGSCWVGFANMLMNDSKELKKLAGIRGKLWGAVTLGYPAVVYQRLPPRNPIRIKEVGLK